MAIASVITGIFSGVTSFFMGLLFGYGVLVALGLYVLGGFAGAVAILGIGLARSLATETSKQKTTDISDTAAA